MRFSRLTRQSVARIVYEDEKTVAISKPSNVAVQGQSWSPAYQRWQAVLKGLNTDRDHKLLPVHRLDAAVSGILLLAKTSDQARKLSAQFRSHQISKSYQAIVYNQTATIDRGLIHLHIRRTDTGPEICRGGDEGAQVALTVIEEVSASKDKRHSILQLRPITGRKHQLRLTLSHVGSPILGDFKYATDAVRHHFDRLELKRIYLHASDISYIDWLSSGKPHHIDISDPAPHDFTSLSQQLNIPCLPSAEP